MLAARVRAGVLLLGASGLLREGPSQQTGVRGETGELVRVFATSGTPNDIIRGPLEARTVRKCVCGCQSCPLSKSRPGDDDGPSSSDDT